MARQSLADRRARERDELRRAQQRFAGGGPLRLDQLRHVDALEFRHLLSWLGRALDAAADPTGARRAESQDGLVRLELWPPADAVLVEIRTPGRARWRRQTTRSRSSRADPGVRPGARPSEPLDERLADERRHAARALLMRPLLRPIKTRSPSPYVRRHSDWLPSASGTCSATGSRSAATTPGCTSVRTRPITTGPRESGRRRRSRVPRTAGRPSHAATTCCWRSRSPPRAPSWPRRRR